MPRPIPGPRWWVGEGALIHRWQAVTDDLSAGAAARVQGERLPGDAPALQPADGIGHRRKRGARQTRCCQTLAEWRGERG